MYFAFLTTLYTITVFAILAIPLYKGSMTQKIVLGLIALIVGYQFHQYQNRRLFTAARHGELIKAQQVLSWGARVNARNALGETPLMFAAGLGHEQVVQMLLDRGADINAFTFEYHTPLHYAVTHGNETMVKKLIEGGAKINAQDIAGYTPLHLAYEFNRILIVQYLLEKGANPNLKTSEGKTPKEIIKKKLPQNNQQQ